jgi:nonribosomal peptide synthetase DhbF
MDGEISPVLTYRPAGDRVPVFLIPAANGLGWAYSRLTRHVPAGHPVHALQDPRLVRGRMVPRDVPGLAADYLAQIKSVQPTGPYVLAGWSFGGTVAQQIAVDVEHKGEEVALLVMLDSFPGDVLGRGEHIRPEDLAGAALDGVPPHTTGIPEIREALIRRDSPLASLSNRAIENLLSAVRENTRAMARHAPGQSSGPVLFVDAAPPDDQSPASETWAPYLTGDVERHIVQFGHGQMLQPDALTALGDLLARKLR